MTRAALFLPAILFGALASRAPAADLDPAYFETHVRPVLAERCYKCHSSTSEKLKGGLRLDSREGMLKGGDTGPAIVPGKPEKSILYHRMTLTGLGRMPHVGSRVVDEKGAKLIFDWIKQMP